jgi:hypothetical protein
MTGEASGPYRDGKIHVHSTMCNTCIFRPGNLMHLRPWRVRGMVDEARANWSVIPCHETLDGDKAVCAGYAELRPQPDVLQVAERLGLIELVDPPEVWP